MAATPHRTIHSISFSTDQKFLTVAHSLGFDLFQVNPFVKHLSFEKLGGILFAEQLESTVLMALVGSGDRATFSSRSLKLFDSQRLCPLSEDFPGPAAIRRVKLSNSRLVIVLELCFYIYNHDPQMNWYSRLFEAHTLPNPNGVCALSSDETSLFAVPQFDDQRPTLKYGVEIYDTKNQRPKTFLPAHDSEITHLAFNPDGTLLATTSVEGTLVRVFDLETQQMIYEFHRGFSRSKITSIVFSPDSGLLACASDHRSVHVFKLIDAAKATAPGRLDRAASWVPVLKRMQSVGSIKKFTLPVGGHPVVLSFSADGQTLFAASQCGVLYSFIVGIDNAGPFRPPEEWSLLPGAPSADEPVHQEASSIENGGGVDAHAASSSTS